MGFPSICYDIVMPKPLDDLLDLWNYFKFMFRLALFHLGLFDPTDWSGSYDVIARVPPRGLPSQESSLPLLSTTADTIKEQLPVVPFAKIAAKGKDDDDDDDDAHDACAICLSCLKGHHQVRKLCNCKHVFHVGCLDRWVDLGQVTCPLCRSVLIPQKEKDCKTGRESWVVERISYLFGEDLLVRY